MSDTWEFVRNGLFLVLFVAIMYGVARVLSKIGDAWCVHILAPLAPAISGIIDPRRRCITGTY